MISKSRLTDSSSKPAPEPTVNALVEISEEAETNGRALELDGAAANTPEVEARAPGDPVDAANTAAAAAAEEETCGEACALGESLETADTDAAAAEERKTCALATFGAGALVETLEAAVDAPER
jgi:hypothetical protein